MVRPWCRVVAPSARLVRAVGPRVSAGSCCSLPAGLGEPCGGVPGVEFESSFCAVFADEDERSIGVMRIHLTTSHPRPCEPAGSCTRPGPGSAWRCPGQEQRPRVQPAARRLPLAPSSTSGLGALESWHRDQGLGCLLLGGLQTHLGVGQGSGWAVPAGAGVG